MKNRKLGSFAILGFALLILPGIVFCQKKTEKSYNKPELGQEGKDVVWYPTPPALVDVMIDMADLTPADYLIDLGSGDGRIVIAAARKGIKSAGIEFNPDLIEFSIENAKKEGVADKTDFIKADFFDYDLSKATVITMFLLPEINRKLKPKLLELKPGTRIITNSFSMQDWPFDEMEEINDESISWNTAYLWIVPAKVDGKWKYKDGELKLSQNYQMVTGNMNAGGKSFKLSEGKLRGNVLSFTCNGVNYNCTINSSEMKGTSENEGKTSVWEAIKLQ
jgi:hypothetical protein